MKNMMEVMKMVDVSLHVNVHKKTAQQKLDWIGGNTVLYLKNAEKIAQATDGRIWIRDEDSARYKLAHERGYSSLEDKVINLLVDAGAKALEEGKIAPILYSRAGMEQKVPIIDVAEIYDDIRKIYEDFEAEKKAREERERRLNEQWEAFKASPAYELYNYYYHRYLEEADKRRYEELISKLKNEMLTEELRAVIEELEKLYRKAKENKIQHEIDKLKSENEHLREEIQALSSLVATLREFISEHHTARELMEFLREKRAEELEEEIREEAKKLVPEFFDEDW